VRRISVRSFGAWTLVLVATVAIALVAVGSDGDDSNVLDAAVAEAADAAGAEEDPTAAIARIFSAHERAFDPVEYERLLQAGDEAIASGSLPTDYAEAADEEGGSSVAFVGFVALVGRAAGHETRLGVT
jgi:hypothetical protein